MTYSSKTLAKIGREVVQQHPEIATGILNSIEKPTCTDLSKIPGYFNEYCLFIGKDPQSVKGPVYKSSITEVKKIFVGAMISIYCDQRLFKKTISDTLEQLPCVTTRMVNEVSFRYKKDNDFKQQVNSILNNIIYKN